MNGRFSELNVELRLPPSSGQPSEMDIRGMASKDGTRPLPPFHFPCFHMLPSPNSPQFSHTTPIHLSLIRVTVSDPIKHFFSEFPHRCRFITGYLPSLTRSHTSNTQASSPRLPIYPFNSRTTAKKRSTCGVSAKSSTACSTTIPPSNPIPSPAHYKDWT